MVRKKEQNRYIIYVSIPRPKPAESSGSPDGLEYYYDHIAIFATENEEKAHTIAELLTQDYEGGPGEDYPEGFLFISEADMSLQERIRAHDQLSNPTDWALKMHEEAARYAEKVRMLTLGDAERNESSSKPDNWEQVSIDILDDDTGIIRSQQKKTRTTWQEVQRLAEKHCRKHGFPGVRNLAKICGCAPSTMDKAIGRSSYLRARRSEYKRANKRLRKTTLTEVHLDSLRQTTEEDPLEQLIAEQKRDMNSDRIL